MLADVSVNKFRSKLRHYVEQVLDTHEPLRVTRRDAGDFVVVGVDDWNAIQETIYVLQNPDLMRQINAARAADARGETGYKPTPEELDAILGV